MGCRCFVYEIPHRLSGLISCSSYKSDTCEEEDESDDTVNGDLFNIFHTAAALHKIDGCQYNSYYTEYGKDYSEHSFFHNVFAY